jgi:hypothetical protein
MYAHTDTHMSDVLYIQNVKCLHACKTLHVHANNLHTHTNNMYTQTHTHSCSIPWHWARSTNSLCTLRKIVSTHTHFRFYMYNIYIYIYTHTHIFHTHAHAHTHTHTHANITHLGTRLAVSAQKFATRAPTHHMFYMYHTHTQHTTHTHTHTLESVSLSVHKSSLSVLPDLSHNLANSGKPQSSAPVMMGFCEATTMGPAGT